MDFKTLMDGKNDEKHVWVIKGPSIFGVSWPELCDLAWRQFDRDPSNLSVLLSQYSCPWIDKYVGTLLFALGDESMSASFCKQLHAFLLENIRPRPKKLHKVGLALCMDYFIEQHRSRQVQ